MSSNCEENRNKQQHNLLITFPLEEIIKSYTIMKYWCLGIFLALPFYCRAQKITISGYITELKSGESMIGATVYVPDKNAGTTTNAFGFYSLTLPADTMQLYIAAPGFETITQRMLPTGNQTLNFRMAAQQKKELQEVTIIGGKESLHSRSQMSTIDLPISTIKSLPAFLGEVDIMKAIQLLPGVQAGNEGSSGIYVRGGGADQNLILLDGVPVYNASHLFGFFSVFNADAIKSVEVTKGGFPARYGGRLSSVIDINMKEGDKNNYHAEGGIGLIASRLTVEGPIQKGKSSFMISGRRTYIDLLSKLFTSDGGYFFYDLNGKVNFRLGAKDHLYISGYFGNDKFSIEDEGGGSSSFKSSIKWGNATGVARWNHQFSPKLFGNLTASYSRYNFLLSASSADNYSGGSQSSSTAYKSGIEDIAFKYDFDFRPLPGHNIRAGLSMTAHTYRPGVIQSKQSSGNINEDTTIGIRSVAAREYDVYVEDDIRISKKLKANIGLHGTAFSVRDQFYTSLQPRLALRYLLNDAMSVKASYTQMNQFIHLLTNSSIGLPTDLWVPATDKVAPMKSQQVTMGFAYTHKKGYELSLEAYYKTMDNVIEYKEGASFLNPAVSWEEKVVSGKGWSYGTELFIQKKKGRFTGMLGYTLSWTKRQFDALNEGKTFPYRYDRRHDFKVAGVYNLTKTIDISAEWVYGTGNAITLPVSAYMGPDGNKVTIYGERNGIRMPAYHRADVSIKFTKEKKHGERAWVISVYNLYNRKNPFYIYQDEAKATFTQISLFPIIPSITYQFRF
jgi:hypothetical protein